MVEVAPGAVSNIPARCSFTLDVRDTSAGTRRAIVAEVDKAVAVACDAGALHWEDATHTSLDPTPLDHALCSLLLEEARRGNIHCRTMHSGAGHDAMILAPEIPAAMIFVPSRGGKSHTPEEHTELADILQGVHLLYRALHRLGYATP